MMSFRKTRTQRRRRASSRPREQALGHPEAILRGSPRDIEQKDIMKYIHNKLNHNSSSNHGLDFGRLNPEQRAALLWQLRRKILFEQILRQRLLLKAQDMQNDIETKSLKLGSSKSESGFKRFPSIRKVKEKIKPSNDKGFHDDTRIDFSKKSLKSRLMAQKLLLLDLHMKQVAAANASPANPALARTLLSRSYRPRSKRRPRSSEKSQTLGIEQRRALATKANQQFMEALMKQRRQAKGENAIEISGVPAAPPVPDSGSEEKGSKVTSSKVTSSKVPKAPPAPPPPRGNKKPPAPKPPAGSPTRPPLPSHPP